MRVVPLPLDVEVRDGDDVAALALAALADAGLALRDGDVLCVASKVVAKAQGATRPVPDGAGVEQARRALARRLARRVVADTAHVLVVETHHGLVCANAGIDASNVPEGLLLLPEDPDGDAARLRAELGAATGTHVGVVVTDTFGRAWRRGQVDVAVGAAGVVALRDDRGTRDRHARALAVTLVAVADELAAAADLVRGKSAGAPFVLVRGLDVDGDGAGADIVRPAREDLFRHGGPNGAEAAVAAAAGTVDDAGAAPRGAAPGRVEDAAVAAARSAALPVAVRRSADGVGLASDDPIAVGAAVEAVAVVAAAHGHRLVLTRGDGHVELRLVPGT